MNIKIKLIFFLFFSNSLAYANCFIAKINEKILIQEGECYKSYPPQSTFKIPLSLIGFDSEILKNEIDPIWKLPNNVDYHIEKCKTSQNPKTWIKNSCLWYSNILVKKLTKTKFEEYISEFQYGNMRTSGELENAWISSSLKISPIQQIKFLQKIINKELNLSQEAYEYTKNLMFIQVIEDDWKLYGKTGSGYQVVNNKKTELKHGWFVGYIEKNNQQIVFATHVLNKNVEKGFASQKAKHLAINNLNDLILKLSKQK